MCLLAAHLPFVWVKWRELFAVEHYQFFPFAVVSFVWLFFSRRLPGSFRWSPGATLLLTADLLLLAAGTWMVSPLLVYSGAVFLLWAICLSVQDRESRCSLSYLIVLLLVTIRPPVQTDLHLIQWLQSATTSVASALLNAVGCLHLQAAMCCSSGKAISGGRSLQWSSVAVLQCCFWRL
ncbi:MAG: archaeosortase/exosortase family protein [Planctomycetaceae bacterium]